MATPETGDAQGDNIRPRIEDAVTDLERSFPIPSLLTLDYFSKYRSGYYDLRDNGFQIPPRNYFNLLKFITEIFEYREDDARSLAKRLRDGAADHRNSEAAFAEIIVYRSYIRLVSEGIIRSVRLGHDECDIIVERLDGSAAFLEVFSIMPHRKDPLPGEIAVRNIRTHAQDSLESVRQKLLRKFKKQKQMTAPRDNYAVIELNDPSIAGDFAVLSSLSSGYKVQIDTATGKQVSAGYDWSRSVFDDECTRNLRGVIWFDLGDYDSRRLLVNPRFGGARAEGR